MNSDVVLLLGRKDEPTDAVEEYCGYLCEALARRGVTGEVVRAAWNERGWSGAVNELRRASESWRGKWVFVQYTALAWSERGFPRRVQRIMRTLRDAGARLGVVFHDVEPFAGTRAVDWLRRRVQLRVMRKMLSTADLAIFTISLDVVSWISSKMSSKASAVFIPVGANLPESSVGTENARDSRVARIAVYGITGGGAGSKECEVIAKAIRFATASGASVELHAFGRGAQEREAELREKLEGMSIGLRVDGLLSADRVASALRAADATLFVRGPISTRRGSAIAGIVCGKPVIAYRGPETAAPIEEAGVVLLEPDDDIAALGAMIQRIATDRAYRDELSKRSARAQETYFSWRAIADRYIEAMKSKA